MIRILGTINRLTPVQYRKYLAAAFLSVYPWLCGMKVERLEGGKLRLTKSGKAAVIAESDFITAVVKNFGRLFSIKGMEYSGNEVDFTREVRLFGFAIRTNAEEALWIEPILLEYNKYRPLREGDVVFDCGGYHGMYSLIVSKAIGEKGRVYCFEPDEGNYDVVKQNLERNGVKNVILVKMGLWGSEATLTFAKNLSHSSHIALDGKPAGETTSINTTTIPAFCQKEKLGRLDFVKMDIEGAELEAIDASLAFLKERKVDFAIASYHMRDGEPTCKKLVKMLSSIGYAAHTEKNSAGEFITYAGPGKQ